VWLFHINKRRRSRNGQQTLPFGGTQHILLFVAQGLLRILSYASLAAIKKRCVDQNLNGKDQQALVMNNSEQTK